MRRRQLLQNTSLLAAAAGAPLSLHAALRTPEFGVVRLASQPLTAHCQLQIAHASGAPGDPASTSIHRAELDLIGPDGRELRLWRMARRPVLNRGREVSLRLADQRSFELRLRHSQVGDEHPVAQQLRLTRGDSVVLIGPEAQGASLSQPIVDCPTDETEAQALCTALTAIPAETLWLRLT